MTSLTSSSLRSSTSFCSSSRYSSSSFRSDGSLTPSSDSLDPFYESFPELDSSSLLGDGSCGGAGGLTPLRSSSRSSCGLSAPVGGAVSGRRSSSGGSVRRVGDSYYMSADVSQFEAHDIVVTACRQQVVVHAEKVLDDGTVCATFSQRSLLPDDADPLSVSGRLTPDGVLVVRVCRTNAPGGLQHPGPPTHYSEVHL